MSIRSGTETLNDKKLLDNIAMVEQNINLVRCETPPEFVDSGLGYYEFMNSIRL